MLTFYPPLYPDELLYSGHARYAERVKYINRYICMDLFQQEIKLKRFGIDKNIVNFVNQLPDSHTYTVDYLIDHHTMFSLYGLIRPSKILSNIRQQMKTSINRPMLCLLGIIENRFLCFLRFCPKCAQKDISIYGEPYWHRLHQIRGIDICSQHGIWLETSTFNKHCFISARQALRQPYLTRGVERQDSEYEKLQCRFADNIAFLLNNPSLNLNIENTKKWFAHLLFEKGTATFQGQVSLKKLLSEYKKCYPKHLINHLDKNLDGKLATLTRHYFRASQHLTPIVPVIVPLLVLDFLNLNMETFMNMPLESKPFGDGPWECRNSICTSFKQPCINECKVIYTAPRTLAGEISCKCGYSYRMHRSMDTGKLNHRVVVVSHGKAWIKEFKRLLHDPSISNSKIYKRLGAPPSSIAEFRRNGKIILNTVTAKRKFQPQKETLRRQWISLVRANPAAKRSDLHKMNASLYKILWKNDRTWFKSNSPKVHAIKPPQRNFATYWQRKDKELLPKIKKAYITLKQNPSVPRRICIHAIEKAIGTKLTNRKNMPLCSQLLSKICEDWKKYVVRRVSYFVDLYIKQGIIPAPSNYYQNLFGAFLEDPSLKLIIDKGYKRIKNAISRSSTAGQAAQTL